MQENISGGRVSRRVYRGSTRKQVVLKPVFALMMWCFPVGETKSSEACWGKRPTPPGMSAEGQAVWETSPFQQEQGWPARGGSSVVAHSNCSWGEKPPEWIMNIYLWVNKGERKLAAFYPREERGELPGLSKNAFREYSAWSRKIKSQGPLKAPGKLHSDWKTAHREFSWVSSQVWSELSFAPSSPSVVTALWVWWFLHTQPLFSFLEKKKKKGIWMLLSPGGLTGIPEELLSPRGSLANRAHGQARGLQIRSPGAWVPPSQTALCQGKEKWGRPTGSFPSLMIWGFCAQNGSFWCAKGSEILRKQSDAVPGAPFKLVLRGRILTSPQGRAFPLIFLHCTCHYFTLYSYFSNNLFIIIFHEDRFCICLFDAAFPGSSTKDMRDDLGKAGMNEHPTWVGLS